MKLFSIAILITFCLVINSFALDSQDIEAKVDGFLQKREITNLANELAKNSSNSTEDLLIKLSVFSRAGHRGRVLETIRKLAEIYPDSTEKNLIVSFVKKYIDRNDFETQKIYYEKLAAKGDDYSWDYNYNFIILWQKRTDNYEIENWLKVRAETSEIWWRQWYVFKKSLGTENEVYAELEQQIRANPKEFDLLEKYFRVMPEDFKDRSWLLDVVPNDTAYEAYDLAQYFSPNIAIKLYKKSISLPFTERDLKLFKEREFRLSSSTITSVGNPEKQTRFWAKRSLARLYQETGQANLAQPLIEELTKMDKSGILASDTSELAGMVQASTGQRVIEKQILKSEKENQNSHEYWLKRAEYYKGRNDKKIVWQTYLKGLSKFEYDRNNRKKLLSRYYILEALAEFGKSHDKLAIERLLKIEISKASSANDGFYLIELFRIVEDDFEDLFKISFVNTDLLPKALSTIKDWGSWEANNIETVLYEDWDEDKRAMFIDRLFGLALADVESRASALAEALEDVNLQKSVFLLETLLAVVSKDNREEDNFPEHVESELFDIYIKSGNWRKAEKMYVNGFNKNGNWHKGEKSSAGLKWKSELSRIAVAAAENGAIEDAVRLWKLNTNFDRRKLTGLSELAITDAKQPLQEFYLDMKQQDALSYIPDKALEILK